MIQMTFRSEDTPMDFCEIFSDCFRCPVPFCPYEKLDRNWLDGETELDEELDEDEEEIEDEGW